MNGGIEGEHALGLAGIEAIVGRMGRNRAIPTLTALSAANVGIGSKSAIHPTLSLA